MNLAYLISGFRDLSPPDLGHFPSVFGICAAEGPRNHAKGSQGAKETINSIKMEAANQVQSGEIAATSRWNALPIYRPLLGGRETYDKWIRASIQDQPHRNYSISHPETVRQNRNTVARLGSVRSFV